MKNISFPLRKTAAALTVAFSMLALGSHAQDTDKTLTGEVLDMACYMGHGAHGPGHMQCAKTCIKGGSPMGLLTSDGKVYLLVENHDKTDAYSEAKKYAGEQITVTGTVAEKGGLPGIIVNEVKKG
ncbi:MAG TPA: hypothetical protein VFS36_00100 [Chitinophagaceae bacterium]|jgi:hypothetical protein|nr:hypothetical protein [Chitinophagaceae bacterium]